MHVITKSLLIMIIMPHIATERQFGLRKTTVDSVKPIHHGHYIPQHLSRVFAEKLYTTAVFNKTSMKCSFNMLKKTNIKNNELNLVKMIISQIF